VSRISSTRELAALRDRLSDLEDVKSRIAQRAAAKLTHLARQAFDSHEGVAGDSFGKGYDGKPLTLVKSGKLRHAATEYEADGNTVSASVAHVPYAKYQLGKGILPTSLPKEWHDEVAAIAHDETARALGGRS
jgi:hypothetical protein